MMVIRPRPGPARVLLAGALLVAVLFAAASPAAAQYVPPVDGVVVDAFRPPAHIGAPGNRGWEYRTTPGSAVRAVGPGTVAFVGSVAGTWYVSIDHPGRLRTTYGGVLGAVVTAGDTVVTGQVIASTAGRFHFGARREGVYIDPALLFGSTSTGPARLVPRPGRVPARSGSSDLVRAPLQSDAGPFAGPIRWDHPGTDQSPPRTTHGRRFGGVGPRLR